MTEFTMGEKKTFKIFRKSTAEDPVAMKFSQTQGAADMET